MSASACIVSLNQCIVTGEAVAGRTEIAHRVAQKR